MENQIDLNFDKKIKLQNSKLHGIGVFATDDFEIGDLIEKAPIIVLSWRMNYHKDPTLWEYLYTHTCACEDCKKHGGKFLMCLGYAQIYNHQDDNNANIGFDLKNKIATIKAIKKIKKDEEIFINYGEGYFKNRKKINVEDLEKNPEKITSVFD